MFIVRALQAHDIDRVCDLMPDFEAYLTKPGFKLNMCRVGVLNGEVIAYVIVEPRILRYGQAQLNAVNIGGIFVENVHRAHGYDQQMMQDALAFIAEQGAHLAFLHAPEGYGGRFGFNPVLAYYWMAFESGAASKLRPKHHIRQIEVQDVPHLANLYHKHWGSRVTFARNATLWMWRVNQPDVDIRVIEAPDGQLSGYIRGGATLTPEVEIVTETPDAAQTVLAHLGRRYHKAGFDEVRWLVPPDDALVVFARHLLDVTLHARYSHTGGWMARLIDTGTLLDTLLPEITAQAQTTPVANFSPQDLMLRCHADRVEIGIYGQDDTITTLNHQDFLQLLFGALQASSLALRADLPDATVRLLNAVFPPRVAAFAVWDW